MKERLRSAPPGKLGPQLAGKSDGPWGLQASSKPCRFLKLLFLSLGRNLYLRFFRIQLKSVSKIILLKEQVAIEEFFGLASVWKANVKKFHSLAKNFFFNFI